MSTTNTQKQAAKQFVKEWAGKGYEKGETQRFWIDLLHTVFGIDNPTKMMEFELPVKTITKEKGSDFIDGYITATKVLIEQKGSHIDLSSLYVALPLPDVTHQEEKVRGRPFLLLMLHMRKLLGILTAPLDILLRHKLLFPIRSWQARNNKRVKKLHISLNCHLFPLLLFCALLPNTLHTIYIVITPYFEV